MISTHYPKKPATLSKSAPSENRLSTEGWAYEAAPRRRCYCYPHSPRGHAAWDHLRPPLAFHCLTLDSVSPGLPLGVPHSPNCTQAQPMVRTGNFLLPAWFGQGQDGDASKFIPLRKVVGGGNRPLHGCPAARTGAGLAGTL